MLAWNAAAPDVLTDFDRPADEDRNILAYMLTDPGARRLFGAELTPELPPWATAHPAARDT